MLNKQTLTYFKTSLAAFKPNTCHISAIVVCMCLCSHMKMRC